MQELNRSFDHRSYVNDKILTRLKTTQSSAGFFAKYSKEIERLLNQTQNVDLTAYSGSCFEDSVIGWINFCKLVEQIVSEGKPLTIESLKSVYVAKGASVVTKKEDIIDEAILNKTAPDLDHLLSIAETEDFAGDFDVSSLTEEGLRNTGAIDKNETSLDAVDFVNKTEEVPVILCPDGDILSPFSPENLIFQIDSTTYMDLDENKIFRVKY